MAVFHLGPPGTHTHTIGYGMFGCNGVYVMLGVYVNTINVFTSSCFNVSPVTQVPILGWAC